MPLLAIVGPTGSGKSAIAVDVAVSLGRLGFPAEIVSADAMQLYRGMNIGTAKILESEQRGVPHHLLDVWDVTEDASVQDYQERARAVISDCFHRGVLPILVGGSGLYVSSVLYRFDFPGTSEEIRERLEAELDEIGLEALSARLLDRDPHAHASVDTQNPRRVIRALEVLELTGRPQTPGLRARGEWWHEPTVIAGVNWPRESLVARIDARVEQMWQRGLVQEVTDLAASPSGMGKTARQAIGYREILDHLAGKLSVDEAKLLVAQHTRRYARKQMSWFRRDANIHWCDPHLDAAVSQILTLLRAAWPTLPAA